MWIAVNEPETEGRVTRPKILSETAGVRVAYLTLEHPKYEAGMPTTQPRRPIHIIIMSSSSSVIRCVAPPVQWLKQGFFPSPQIMSRSNVVHSASYLVGTGAHARGKSSRSVKITIHPTWFRLEMRNCSSPYACTYAVLVRQLLQQKSKAGSLHSDLLRCNFNSDDIPCRLHYRLRYTDDGSQVYSIICLSFVNSSGTRKNLVKVLWPDAI